METNPNEARTPRTHFFAGRHVRGWIVIGSVACALGFIANALTFTIDTDLIGAPANGVDGWTVTGVMGSLAIAGIAWSVRISDAILKAMERVFGRQPTHVPEVKSSTRPRKVHAPHPEGFKRAQRLALKDEES